MAQFPVLNGHLHSFASAEIDFGGSRFFGISALNWSEELTPEDVYGNGAPPIGRTKGEYKASADFEQVASEFMLLLDKLGDGYGEVPFNIGCSYVEAGSTITVQILGARITKVDVSNARGPAGTMYKVTLSVIVPILTNGKSILRPSAQATSVGGLQAA